MRGRLLRGRAGPAWIGRRGGVASLVPARSSASECGERSHGQTPQKRRRRRSAPHPGSGGRLRGTRRLHAACQVVSQEDHASPRRWIISDIRVAEMVHGVACAPPFPWRAGEESAAGVPGFRHPAARALGAAASGVPPARLLRILASGTGRDRANDRGAFDDVPQGPLVPPRPRGVGEWRHVPGGRDGPGRAVLQQGARMRRGQHRVVLLQEPCGARAFHAA